MGLAVVGLAAAPVSPGSLPALDGSWTVARATVNGVARASAKMLNATWTFRGTDLVVEDVHGERLHATLSVDAAAEPPAFLVEPPGQRPFWVIWAKQADELRLAFYDGLDRRPEDFGPRRKLIVLALVPTDAAAIRRGPDACAVLRAAGVERFLGGPTQARPAQRRASTPGARCEIDRTDGSRAISLVLVAPPAGPAYVEAARQEADADRRTQIDEEPTLGGDAFSAVHGWTVVVVALRRGTALILKFQGLGAERAELRRFAARVLDAL
jgi:uncharacterized protein (TIGR03067 family)